MIFFKLVKSGYGSLREVMEMNSREVIQALNYERYMIDYESAELELNKS